MRVRQLTANLIQLTRLHFVNAYLVREDDGFTLVDTMVARSGDAVLAAADGGRRADPAHRGHSRSRRPRRLARRATRATRRRGAGLDARARRPHPRRREGRGGQAPGLLAGGGDATRRVARARRSRRQPRGDRGARPHARPRRLPRHARPARCSPGTCSRPSAEPPCRATSRSRSRSPRWRPGTRSATSSRPARSRALEPQRLAVGHGPVLLRSGERDGARDRARPSRARLRSRAKRRSRALALTKCAAEW